ncbi:PAS domain S-box protein [Nitratireductor sp. CAU 1489]|uniref:PAS domain S-box protein n=2 Tax=Nitratireductor arenosus TaxID=2682096 RepID=A0A844QC92_9HYPH|nr:PAS domain S-box protein [Nitratireductor arenosus]
MSPIWTNPTSGSAAPWHSRCGTEADNAGDGAGRSPTRVPIAIWLPRPVPGVAFERWKEHLMGALIPGFHSDARAIVAAMDASQAVIHFDLKGTILHANENFRTALGYELSEIVGKHHRLFVEPAYAESADYREFWAKLARGEHDQRQYRRIRKDGSGIWIEASYNPVFRRGKPYKVVKFATDITDQKMKAVEDAGKLDAISRSQAVIEFTPRGEIIAANENFCATLGYELAEIRGRHHRMFCEPGYAGSDDYRLFWQKLAQGEPMSGEFLRVGKAGKEIWIQAAYNPILDLDGRVFKVVKFATDVSERMGAIATLGAGLRALADGDLHHRLDEPFVPTMEGTRNDFNDSVVTLRTAMQAVGDNARAITSGSDEIRSAADDLSRRTEQQAASVEETAAALNQITASVTEAACRAEEAGTLVAQTRANAERSGEVVRKAVEAMGQIESSSQEISNIIGMIDEIAFQTNLLALNAGVEAARAGEAGRGFAVVAQEVRELAQRSASAAQEIKSLIGGSGEQVRSGVSLVGETGTVLEEIVGQVQRISDNVAAIVESAREQSISLKEVNEAVGEIDKSTQQNAAMVEQSTAASHSLAKEAQALFTLLGRFRLESAAQARPIALATSSAHAVESPARRMAGEVRTAFGAAAVAAGDGWEEY